MAAFAVANTMTMAILERRHEIGLMKAVGATDQDILTIHLIEAGLVGLIGGSTNLGFINLDLSQLNGSLIVIQPELALFALALAA